MTTTSPQGRTELLRPDGSPVRVLVVDDEMSITELLSMALRYEGWQIRSAGCPFGYAGVESAVRGLLSTGLCDAAIVATGQEQIEKELTEALHPYRRPDGTVWMPNVFRYLIARTP